MLQVLQNFKQKSNTVFDVSVHIAFLVFLLCCNALLMTQDNVNKLSHALVFCVSFCYFCFIILEQIRIRFDNRLLFYSFIFLGFGKLTMSYAANHRKAFVIALLFYLLSFLPPVLGVLYRQGSFIQQFFNGGTRTVKAVKACFAVVLWGCASYSLFAALPSHLTDGKRIILLASCAAFTALVGILSRGKTLVFYVIQTVVVSFVAIQYFSIAGIVALKNSASWHTVVIFACLFFALYYCLTSLMPRILMKE